MTETQYYGLLLTVVIQLVTAAFFAGGMWYMVRALKETMMRLEEWLKDHDTHINSNSIRLTELEVTCRSRHPRHAEE